MGAKQLPHLFLFISLTIAGGAANSMDGDYHQAPSDTDLEAQDDGAKVQPTSRCASPKLCSLALGLGTVGLISFVYYAQLGMELGSALGDDLTSIDVKVGSVQMTLEQAKTLLVLMMTECQKCIPQ